MSTSVLHFRPLTRCSVHSAPSPIFPRSSRPVPSPTFHFPLSIFSAKAPLSIDSPRFSTLFLAHLPLFLAPFLSVYSVSLWPTPAVYFRTFGTPLLIIPFVLNPLPNPYRNTGGGTPLPCSSVTPAFHFGIHSPAGPCTRCQDSLLLLAHLPAAAAAEVDRLPPSLAKGELLNCKLSIRRRMLILSEQREPKDLSVPPSLPGGWRKVTLSDILSCTHAVVRGSPPNTGLRL